MAKHTKGKRRGFRRYLKGSVDEVLPIGTLAPRSLVAVVFDEGVNERTFISSMKATWAISDWSTIANNGPLQVGVAHSDYSAAEIEAWIENQGSWNEGDLVNQEIAKRKIRTIGIFQDPDAVTKSEVLNDGKPITTKLGWILLQGQTLDLWGYNLGSAAFATTDPQVHVQGHANLWPQ